MAWLPDGGLLITERPGRVTLYRDGKATEVTGAPRVLITGQGGLLDISLHPDFAENRLVYMTIAEGTEDRQPHRPGAGNLRRARVRPGRDPVPVRAGQDRRPNTSARAWPGFPTAPWCSPWATAATRPSGSTACSHRDMAQIRSVPPGQAGPAERRRPPRPRPRPLTATPPPACIPWATATSRGWPGTPQRPHPVGQRARRARRRRDQPHRGRGQLRLGPLPPTAANTPCPWMWPTTTPCRAWPTRRWSGSGGSRPPGCWSTRGDAFPGWKGDLLAGGLRSETIRLIELDRDGTPTGERDIPMGDRVRDIRQGPDGAGLRAHRRGRRQAHPPRPPVGPFPTLFVGGDCTFVGLSAGPFIVDQSNNPEFADFLIVARFLPIGD